MGVGKFVLNEGLNMILAPGSTAIRMVKYVRVGLRAKQFFYDSCITEVAALFKKAIANARQTGK
jgi:hypothetical protein